MIKKGSQLFTELTSTPENEELHLGCLTYFPDSDAIKGL